MEPRLAGKVAVVAGAGGGIGSRVAVDLARNGAMVIAVDSGVGVQGEPLGEETASETVRLITEEGGLAMASTTSVTDTVELSSLFRRIADEHGSVDIVVHAAGILRFSHIVDSSEDDWASVLDVHFGGYLNILSSALPIMMASGYGRIVGLTSGSGLARTSPGSIAYGTAKRAMAALTWELGRILPAEIRVSALSPIAATRMVRAAIMASNEGPREVSPQAVDLSAMPQPDDMARAVNLLVRDEATWSQGRILFSTGSEHSIIEAPRLLECIRSGDVSFADALATLVPEVLDPAEASQRTGGGSNSRFGDVFSDREGEDLLKSQSRCLIVSDDDFISNGVREGLARWGVSTHEVRPSSSPKFATFDDPNTIVNEFFKSTGLVDVIVVVASRLTRLDIEVEWEELIESHATVTNQLLFHGSWMRAAARAHNTGRRMRLILITPALTSSGRTTAQAAAQMVRNVNDVASLSLDAFSVSLETDDPSDIRALGAVTARLSTTDDVLGLRGAELVVGHGWIGIRSHPAPSITVSSGDSEIPPWVNTAFREWSRGA